jgi:hypothetical protein
MPARTFFTRFLAAAVVVIALGAFGVASASAATAGILPPANPATDCDARGGQPDFTVKGLDRCRAKEGVGRLVLPSNWAALTGPQQLLVLIDLERVNRGLAPVVGLSPALDRLAAAGARSHADPSFPSGGFQWAGGVWSSGASTITADYGWMYDDGPKGLDINEDCPASGRSSSCWLHRDIILRTGSSGALVGGAGSTRGSYAFEILAGYSSVGLTFTWARELRYFATKPGVSAVAP